MHSSRAGRVQSLSQHSAALDSRLISFPVCSTRRSVKPQKARVVLLGIFSPHLESLSPLTAAVNLEIVEADAVYILHLPIP